MSQQHQSLGRQRLSSDKGHQQNNFSDYHLTYKICIIGDCGKAGGLIPSNNGEEYLSGSNDTKFGFDIQVLL